MSMMFMIKMPCILAATVGIHITNTAPNPPPPAKEHSAFPSLFERYLRLGRYFMQPIVVFCWFVAMAEIATALASLTASSPFSKRVLSMLAFDKDVIGLYLTPLSLLGMFLMAFGGWMRLQCYRSLKTLFTFEMSIRNDHRLVTTGPYSVVRHPSYTGAIMAFIGVACWYGSPGSWVRESGVLHTGLGKLIAFTLSTSVIGVAIGLLRRMEAEDAALRNCFDKEWEEWAEKVPYSLIPGVY